MDFDEREYARYSPRRRGLLADLPPVVRWLLITNVSLFILDYLILAPFNRGLPPILESGAFTIRSGIHHHQYWEFLSFQFIHGGLLHLMMNSMAIYFFGPWLERFFGSLRFTIYYLLCGVAGAGFFTLLSHIGVLPYQPDRGLVGASAGLYGILVGIAIIAPSLRVQLLFPPVTLSMRQLAIALMALATFIILFRLNNAGGEAGHLGGAIIGFLLMKSGIFNSRPPPIP